jgi:hypothetical protein
VLCVVGCGRKQHIIPYTHQSVVVVVAHYYAGSVALAHCGELTDYSVSGAVVGHQPARTAGSYYSAAAGSFVPHSRTVSLYLRTESLARVLHRFVLVPSVVFLDDRLAVGFAGNLFMHGTEIQ